jgi:hypothetical protein
MGAFADGVAARRIVITPAAQGAPMRKILALLALAVAVSAVTAGPAAADDPGAVSGRSVTGNVTTATCTHEIRAGVSGQFGAWGDFVDGCTVKYRCLGPRGCTVEMNTHFAAYGRPFVDVTQNARLRVYKARSRTAVLWQTDVSCAGNMSCANRAASPITLKRGQYASAQCNGVKRHVYGEPGPMGANTCAVVFTRIP